jgi:hypothetical protein
MRPSPTGWAIAWGRLFAAQVFGHGGHFQRRHFAGNGVHHRVVVGPLALVELF